MKKIACVIMGILLVGILAFVGIKIYKKGDAEKDPNYKWRDSGWFPGEYEAYFVREKIPTDIIWYGEWTGNEFEIPVRFESEVSDEILKIRDGYQKAYIVVIDLDGTVALTDEDYELMCQYINNDARYNFIYIGTERLAYLAELEGYDPDNITYEDCSIGFYRYDDALYANYGTYMVSDKGLEEFLCTYLLSSFENYFFEE